MIEVHSDILYQYNIHNLTNFLICRENFMTIPIVIYTRKNFYLLNAINVKIEQLKAAGLIEYWYSLAFTKELKRHKKNPPKVFTFRHLSGCFQIWIGGCVISFCVFFVELIAEKLKWNVQKVKDLY